MNENDKIEFEADGFIFTAKIMWIGYDKTFNKRRLNLEIISSKEQED